MTFIPDKIINKLKENYRESSLKTMDGQIKRIHKMANLDKFNEKLLIDLKKMKNLLNNMEKTNVKKSLINSSMKVLEVMDNVPNKLLKEYKEWFRLSARNHENKYHYGELDEKQKDSFISLEEIKKMRGEYSKKNDLEGNPYEYLKYVVLSLYTYLPPLRGEDYFKTRLIKCPSFEKCLKTLPYNFYDLKTNKLVLKEYKTSGTHGTRIIEFPSELSKIIDKWAKINPSDFLIPNLQTKNAMSQSGFTDFLNRLFKPHKISTSMLRKIYISETVPKLSVSERKTLAKTMAHSLVMQEFIYRKNLF